MKVPTFKLILPFLILMATASFMYATHIDGGKKEFVKKVERTFDISSSGKVDLSNRHGKVEVKTWDKNSVEIEVSIIVHARNESTASEVFDRIDIDFSNSSDYVKAATNIESHKNSWWTSSNKTDYEINYLVHMPKSNSLKLFNKYGHSFVESIDGDMEADIKYGDISTAHIGGDLNLILGYGNGTIEQSADATINIKYSNLHLKKAKDINIESKYSNMFFTEVGDVKTDSKYDTYDLGSIGKLRGDGKYDNFKIESADDIDVSSRYTQLKVENLQHSAFIDLEYGGFRVQELSRKFSELKLKGKHTEFKIGIEDGAQFTFNAKVKHGGIHYPDGMEVTHDIRQSHSHEVKGYQGSASASSSIRIENQYGSIKVYN